MEMRVLAGDIGGTKTLLQIAECKGGPVIVPCVNSASTALPTTACPPSFTKSRKPEKNSIRAACFGIAGPIQEKGEGAIRQSHQSAVGRGPELQRRFKFSCLRLINDFQAIGYGIEALRNRKTVLCSRKARP